MTYRITDHSRSQPLTPGPAEPDYFTTIYRNDIARWGGMTYKRQQEDISREIDVSRTAASSSTVSRCMQSMRSGCRPVTTGTTLYRDSYVPHMASSRDIGPTYSRRCPAAPPPPDAADPSILRPTTEYGSKYRVPHPEPFLRPELVARCSTAHVTSRSIGREPQFCPGWDTTYRNHYCERVTRPVTSDAVTFHTHTGLR
jgi:hypothetical protein